MRLLLRGRGHTVHPLASNELTEEAIRRLSEICEEKEIDIIVFHLPEDFYRLFLDQVTTPPLERTYLF